MSSILHLLPLIYPIITCVDPNRQRSWRRIQFGSGSTTLKQNRSRFRFRDIFEALCTRLLQSSQKLQIVWQSPPLSCNFVLLCTGFDFERVSWSKEMCCTKELLHAQAPGKSFKTTEPNLYFKKIAPFWRLKGPRIHKCFHRRELFHDPNQGRGVSSSCYLRSACRDLRVTGVVFA